MIKLMLLSSLIFSTIAVAAPGVSEPVHGKYKDPNDLAGLCVGDNEKYHYSTSGHCLTIMESLRNQPCIKEKLEEIRLRYIRDQKFLEANKEKNTSSPDLDFSCHHRDDYTQDLKTLAGDPDKFAMVMMQLFALIVIEESEWKVLDNASGDAQQPTPKCEKDCGLFGLDRERMLDKKYSCGCQPANKEDQIVDPTMDGHLNLKCGITMALFEAIDEKQNISILGGGKPGSEVEAYGFAKVFKSLQTPAEDKEGIDTPKERIAAKMRAYCEDFAFTGKTIIKWEPSPDSKGPKDIGGAAGAATGAK